MKLFRLHFVMATSNGRTHRVRVNFVPDLRWKWGLDAFDQADVLLNVNDFSFIPQTKEHCMRSMGRIPFFLLLSNVIQSIWSRWTVSFQRYSLPTRNRIGFSHMTKNIHWNHHSGFLCFMRLQLAKCLLFWSSAIHSFDFYFENICVLWSANSRFCWNVQNSDLFAFIRCTLCLKKDEAPRCQFQ